MQYNLLKQLREAKFETPENPSGSYGKFSQSNGSFDEVYIPTFEELVDACGEDFTEIRDLINLQKQAVHPMNIEPDFRYEAVSSNQKPTKYAHGETPKIAVANLYLKLKDPLSSL